MRPPGPPLLVAAGLALGLAAAAPAGGQTTFVDVTDEAGLSYVQRVPPAFLDCMEASLACEVFPMTGGAAVADVDGDGWTDVFVTRLDAPDLLFRNLGNGRFEDVSEAAGLDAFDLQSNGALFGDFDNDGDPDLFVTVVGTGDDPVNGRNYLFVNDGSGRFDEEAVARGAADASLLPRLLFSASLGDYDRDGWLDLHLNEWLRDDHSRLLRNRGAEAPGHFEDVTESANAVLDRVDGFASTFVDLDDDGWQDLAVAADFGTSRLLWNQRDGTFLDGTVAAGVGTDENGMGSTFGDFDADGDLDWFVTSIRDPAETCETENCSWGYTGNRLYRNEGGRLFSDATDDAGVRDGFWGWGTVFFDYDNDEDLDLVMTNGVIYPQTGIDDDFNADPMRVWENDGTGATSEVSSEVGVLDTSSGKGLLTFDYDRDGDLDLLVVNNAGTPRLYRNELAAGSRWLRLRIQGTESNRDAAGARVTLWPRPGAAPQVREVGVASHFLGQSEAELHFGLAPGTEWVHEVRVEFPASGRVVRRGWLEPNQTYVISEDAPACGRLDPEILLALVPVFVVARRRRAEPRSGR